MKGQLESKKGDGLHNIAKDILSDLIVAPDRIEEIEARKISQDGDLEYPHIKVEVKKRKGCYLKDGIKAPLTFGINSYGKVKTTIVDRVSEKFEAPRVFWNFDIEVVK